MLRRAASVALAALLAAGLVACTGGNDDLADQYRAGDNKGYIGAAGLRYEEIPVAERGEPVEFAGVVESGEQVSSADYAGGVLVVNLWYAACAPCRAEAPALEEAYQAFEGEPVAFLGLNTSDSAETALAFADTYDITYPSLITVDDRDVKLAFADVVPLAAVPSTLVLDREGRVAARIIGQLPGASILKTLVDDVLAETS